MKTDEEQCVAALRSAADILGKSPTKSEYEELGLTPAHSTILQVMGSWNKAKEAAGLELYSQIEWSDGSVKPKPDHVELREDTPWESLSPQQRWYYRNRNHRMTIKNHRKKELQRWFFEYKRDNCCCERCGETHPVCLDFHHFGEKRADVSKMVTEGYSKANIEKEMDRCSVLCANCHQRHHNDPPDFDGGERPNNREDARLDGKRYRRLELRAWVHEYKAASSGCARCGEDDPVCLEFHHRNEAEKTRSISTLISFAPSRERLKEEIDKCEILCRNCHRKEHYNVPEKREE